MNANSTTAQKTATHIACATIVLLLAACSDNNPSQAGDTTEPTNIRPDVTLEATVLEWSDSSMRISYELRNSSSDDIIVLGDQGRLQIQRRADNSPQLLRGKQNTGLVDFVIAPTIAGTALSPAASVMGTGSRPLPLQLDYPITSADVDFTFDPNIDAIEFCVGYGLSTELLPTGDEEGRYSLNQDIDLQQLACTELARDTDSSMTDTNDTAVALGDDQWQTTLKNTLNLLSNDSTYDRSLSANFKVLAPWTINAPLSVSVTEPLGGLAVGAAEEFNRGQLILETPNGYRLILDANSGETGSALITFERDGVVMSIMMPWAELLS